MSPRDLVIVAGMVAGDPYQGGATWAVLQYVLGLRQLGFDVLVVDALRPGEDRPEVRTYFEAVCRRFELTGRAALLDERSNVLCGADQRQVDEMLRRSVAVLNLSGRWRDLAVVEKVPVRVYVDLDPAFTQLWHAQGADVGLAAHTHHVTVGAGLVTGSSPVPTHGLEWVATLPPIVLDRWPIATDDGSARRLTTIANWRSYGSIEHQGVHYGQKAHSFRQLAALPGLSPVPLGVALSIHEGDAADRDHLVEAGWHLLDPVKAGGDPDSYQRFVQRSWGELGVAKAGYVTGRTGWFSDRTACYLAAGRPAVVQDTGLDGVLPMGEGLLTFSSPEEAADAIRRVVADYPWHRAAARAIAEAHLDARRVLTKLLDAVLS